MFIATQDFGEIEIESKDIISFVQPIFGFENLRQFVMIQDQNIGQQFAWLQSVENHAVCFILIDSAILAKKYPPAWPEDITKVLSQDGLLEPKCWNLAVIPKSFKDTTVNLKSPIFIDANKKLGVQLILEEDYPIRYPLLLRKKG